MEYQFNINYDVKVKLTTVGLNLYWKYYNTYLRGTIHSETVESFKSKMDSDKYISIPMHEFMECFGPVVGPDFDKYCSTTIQLDKKHLVNQSQGRIIRTKSKSA